MSYYLKQNKDCNIQLLKIVLMLMVVSCHLMVSFGYPTNWSIINQRFSDGTGYFLGWSALSAFLFITCWYMSENNFSSRRWLKIWLEVLFFNMFFLILNLSTGKIKETNFDSISNYFLPIIKSPQTFISYYLIFLLYQPFLKILNSRINNDGKIILSSVLLIPYFIWKFFNLTGPLNIFIHQIYICGLYFAASYLRSKGYNFKKRYCALVLLLIASLYFIIYSGYLNYVPKYLYSGMFYADNIFATVAAIALFYLFKNIKIGQIKTIDILSRCTLSVLLLHSNLLSYNVVFSHIKIGQWFDIKLPLFILLILFSAICVYILGFVFDLIRVYCFERPLFKIKQINTFLNKIDLIFLNFDKKNDSQI